VIRALSGLVIAMGAYLVTLPVQAQTTEFPQWRHPTLSTAWSYQIASECAKYTADLGCSTGIYVVWNGSTRDPDVGGDPHHRECAVQGYFCGGSTPSGPLQWLAVSHQHTTTGPPAEECSGLASEGVGEQFTTTTFPGADGYCHALSKCRMSVTSSLGLDGATLYTVKHTNQSCVHGAQPPPPEGSLTEGESCATGSGAEFCLSNSGENCGYLNDSFVCLPQIEADGCDVFGDGSRVCGPSAPTPPVPDNGTPGQPAIPDELVTVNNNSQTTIYNYFNSTTVSNSNRPPGNSGDNPYDGRDDGDGAGGVGEGEGDDSCPEGATCDGTLPDGGEFGEVCTFGECAQAFYERVLDAPIVAAVSGAAQAFPSGSCPTWTLEMFGEEFSLSQPMCQLWDQIAPLLSGLFLVIWAWVATRIVLSA
jgi:hypothetical protein